MENQETSASSRGCVGTSCCTVYEQPWVEELLGESFHPGGMELTERSIASLKLAKGSRLLDVACGTGITAQALAKAGFEVVGIDASAKQVQAAIERAGDSASLTFRVGSAETLCDESITFDGIFCECALSLVADKRLVTKNWMQALRPGGRLAISDMVVIGQLPESLRGQVGSWACLGGALSVESYTQILEEAGFEAIVYEDEATALSESISQLKRKLLLYGIGRLAEVTQDLGVSLNELKRALQDAKKAADEGTLSYGRFSATRPNNLATET